MTGKRGSRHEMKVTPINSTKGVVRVSTYFKFEMKVGVNKTAQSLHKCCRKDQGYQEPF